MPAVYLVGDSRVERMRMEANLGNDVETRVEGGMKLERVAEFVKDALERRRPPKHIVVLGLLGDILERVKSDRLGVRYCRRRAITVKRAELCDKMAMLTAMADRKATRLWFILPMPVYDLRKYLRHALIKANKSTTSPAAQVLMNDLERDQRSAMEWAFDMELLMRQWNHDGPNRPNTFLNLFPTRKLWFQSELAALNANDETLLDGVHLGTRVQAGLAKWIRDLSTPCDQVLVPKRELAVLMIRADEPRPVAPTTASKETQTDTAAVEDLLQMSVDATNHSQKDCLVCETTRDQATSL